MSAITEAQARFRCPSCETEFEFRRWPHLALVGFFGAIPGRAVEIRRCPHCEQPMGIETALPMTRVVTT